MEPGSTVAELLDRVRRDRFVGRRAERALVEEALAEPDPEPLVLFLVGPGGIGKSRLLEIYAEIAARAGSPVCQLSARDLSTGASGIRQTVRRAFEGAVGGRPVLLIDDYEQVGAELDDWVRGLLGGLSVGVLTVLAGRDPPGPGWRVDDGWRTVLRVVGLRNLSSGDCRVYLDRRGIPDVHHEALVSVSHGHPLALSLLADTVEQAGAERPVADLDLLDPDLLGMLVGQFLDAVPTPQQREALEVCALARLTTESLLRDVLAVAHAGSLMAWLAGLSFVATGRGGLEPHDLARDVIDRDLRRRDPQRYADLFRAVRAHVHGRVRGLRGRAQQHAIFDEKFLFRNLPSILSPVDWETWGQLFPDLATADERDVVLAMVARAEGAASREVAARWWAVQPEAFYVQRRADGSVRGTLALVELTAAAGGDGALPWDPVADAALRHAHAVAPPRAGELVTLTRFVVDAETYQRPSPTVNAIPVLTIQRYLDQPNLSWDFLALHAPDPMDPYFAVADLPRVPGVDPQCGGRRYGLYAHDFRVRPVDDWLELVTERALAQDPMLPAPTDPQPLLLSFADFAVAVRDALRSVGDEHALAHSPLLRTRVVADHAEGVGREVSGATLRDCVTCAVEQLGGTPAGEKQRRAVSRTYLHGTTTQEAAAHALGLPFSTYRRHLTAGVEGVVERLWSGEIHGSA